MNTSTSEVMYLQDTLPQKGMRYYLSCSTTLQCKSTHRTWNT